MASPDTAGHLNHTFESDDHRAVHIHDRCHVYEMLGDHHKQRCPLGAEVFFCEKSLFSPHYCECGSLKLLSKEIPF